MATHPFEAVMFDLLTGLLDSWSLWNRIAGSDTMGMKWRLRYLELTYGTGAYRDYQSLVAEAAGDVGLPVSSADRLVTHWDELEPWPEARDVLGSLDLPLGVVTNCSEALATRAARRIGVTFAVTVSAERAGAYKPDPRPYRLALEELNARPEAVLFVAGSPYDVIGAADMGMRVFWHNRAGLEHTAGQFAAAVSGTLEPLPSFALGHDQDPP